MKYRIMQEKYYNEFGFVTKNFYSLWIRKSFLGISYWSSAKREICDGWDIVLKKIEFGSESAALNYFYTCISGTKKSTLESVIVKTGEI